MRYENLKKSCQEGKKFEMLKDGKILFILENRFQQQPNRETMLQFFDCLTDSLLMVPMIAKVSEANQEILKNAKVGDKITLTEEVRMVPDYLQNPEGKIFLPIFSQLEQADKEYLKQFSTVWLHISDVLELYKHPREKLEGIILDPHTSKFLLDDYFIGVIENIMKVKEEELNK